MGGGNNLNIIRMLSLNEVKIFIISSDLNGTITPSNLNTWQFNSSFPWWAQNNYNDLAYYRQLKTNLVYGAYKNSSYQSVLVGNNYISFHPVIEYKE